MPVRAFLHCDSQAGCFHVINRIYDQKYLIDEEGKEFFLKLVRAYEDVIGLEVLTFCVMDNHFHLLLRVPHRPEGFDVDLEVIVARLDRALGEKSARKMHRDLAFWREAKNESAIENWRKEQLSRMFSLSEFMKAVQLRFSCWHNRRANRKGALWEGRYRSVIVEEEERALRTMAAYIDLNPVRAGMVGDPGDYRWCGYAEAMAKRARSRRGVVRIIGQAAWPRALAAGAQPWGADVFPGLVEQRALAIYRAILGGQGGERKREDGTTVRRGLSEKMRAKLTTPNERRLAAEVLMRRVRHFTRGVIFGSRAMIDEWFQSNRWVVTGRSRTERRCGAKSLGQAALRGLYALRDVR